MKLHKDTIFCTIVMVVALAVAGFLGFLADNLNAEEPQPAPECPAVELLHQQNNSLSEWEVLMLALAYTESKFNPRAIGKTGDYGAFQITKPYCDELNRIYGTHYVPTDAFDIPTAVKMIEQMNAYYNPEKDIEKAIRLHNKSRYYRAEVERNRQLIRNMEAVRKEVVKQPCRLAPIDTTRNLIAPLAKNQ